MKPKKAVKKMSLNKTTLTNLDNDTLFQVKAGVLLQTSVDVRCQADTSPIIISHDPCSSGLPLVTVGNTCSTGPATYTYVISERI